MTPRPLITLTMAAAAGYDAQPLHINANNVSGVYRWRRKVGHPSSEAEVLGTYVCTGTHDFMVEEDVDTVMALIRAALGS